MRRTAALLAGLALLVGACSDRGEMLSTPSAEGTATEAMANVSASTSTPAAGVRAAASDMKAPEARLSTARLETARRAVEAAFAQESMHFDFTLSITGISDLPGSLTFSGDGGTDFANGRSRMRVDFSSFIEAFRYQLTPEEAVELDAAFGDGSMEVITDGATTYMLWPFMATLLDVDTPWISVQAPVNANLLEGLQGGGLRNAFGYGPQGFLAMLELLDSFEEVGTEEIRGVLTTHWAGTVSFERLFELGDPSARGQFAWQMQQLGLFDLSLPLDVWVDADGLTRRFDMSLDLGLFEPSTAGAKFEFRYDFYDFGVPVDATLPPPAEVTDVTDLMASGVGF